MCHQIFSYLTKCCSLIHPFEFASSAQSGKKIFKKKTPWKNAEGGTVLLVVKEPY
jgi:hypothetical protein